MHDCAAYVDESYREHDTAGFYVLAAAIFALDNRAAARQAMFDLRGSRRTAKLHWHEMDADDRRQASAAVRGLDGMYLVTVGTPVHYRRQERARRISLRRLVFELHRVGVTQIYMEARQDLLDSQDVQLVSDARHDLPKGTRLRVDHQRGADEPLFWVPDIVAGAVRVSQEGQDAYRAMLGDHLLVIEVDCR